MLIYVKKLHNGFSLKGDKNVIIQANYINKYIKVFNIKVFKIKIL